MRYSPTSTTTSVTYLEHGQRPYALQLRGSHQLPQTGNMTPPSPIDELGLYGFHNAPPSEVPSPPSDSYDWRTHGPPPLIHSRSPYATIPLPSLTPGQPEINELLEYTPVSMLEYDISQPPSFASMNRRRGAAARSLDECATLAASTSLTIRIPFSSRPVVVHRFGAAVTVRDVLDDVYAHLRERAFEQIHPQAWTGLMGAQPQFDRVAEARVQHALAQLLGNRRRWAGLSPSPTEPDVWLLHVG